MPLGGSRVWPPGLGEGGEWQAGLWLLEGRSQAEELRQGGALKDTTLDTTLVFQRNVLLLVVG